MRHRVKDAKSQLALAVTHEGSDSHVPFSHIRIFCYSCRTSLPLILSRWRSSLRTRLGLSASARSNSSMRAEMSVPATPTHNSTNQGFEEDRSAGTWVPNLNSIRADLRVYRRAGEQLGKTDFSRHRITTRSVLLVLSKPAPPHCNLKCASIDCHYSEAVAAGSN